MMPRSVASIKKFEASLWIIVIVGISARNVIGRKCVCTSKACKEAGVEICRTRFSCYTEEIYGTDATSGDNSSTRGCTEGATPLLCETSAWTRSSGRISTARDPEKLLSPVGKATARRELVWPRLKCCDTHDYCNSIVNDRTTKSSVYQSKSSTNSTLANGNSSSSVPGSEKTFVDRGLRVERPETSLHNRDTVATRDFENRERSYDRVGHRTRPLHIAAVVLAIAALTSVLGACYVITRFANLSSTMQPRRCDDPPISLTACPACTLEPRGDAKIIALHP